MAQVEAIQQVSSSANRLMLKLTKKRPDNEGSASSALEAVAGELNVLLSGKQLWSAVEEFLQVGLPGMGADAELLPSLEELGLPTAAELEAPAKPQVKQEQAAQRLKGSKRPADDEQPVPAAAAKRQRPASGDRPPSGKKSEQQRQASLETSQQSQKAGKPPAAPLPGPDKAAARKEAARRHSQQDSVQQEQQQENKQQAKAKEVALPHSRQKGASQAPAAAAAAAAADSPLQEQGQQQDQAQPPSPAPAPSGPGAAAPAAAEAYSSEQAAASRDTAAAAAAAALAAAAECAAGGGAGVVGAPPSAAAAAGFTLLEVPPGDLTPAAAALSTVVVGASNAPRPVDTMPADGVAAQQYIDAKMEEAKKIKKKADGRYTQAKHWDVYSLCLYAQAAVKFMESMDAHERIWGHFQRHQLPMGPLRHPGYMAIYKQTAQLCHTAKELISNARGPDIAKQALRLLMERLYIICMQRHHHSKQHGLLDSARRLKAAAQAGAAAGGSTAAAAGGGGSSSGSPSSAAPGVRLARREGGLPPSSAAAAAAAVAATAAGGGGGGASDGSRVGGSAAEGKPLNKASEGSSAQDTTSLLKLSAAGPGRPVTGSTQAPAGAVNRNDLATVLDMLHDMLRMSDSIHSGVLRLQQFLESPEVMANAAAKQAALEVSVLALDGGMYSMQHVSVHAYAAISQVIKMIR